MISIKNGKLTMDQSLAFQNISLFKLIENKMWIIKSEEDLKEDILFKR